MDDDIDIEEHDLMDNPRIKSIFPDLSCVKIEIPDDDDIEDQYGEVPISYQTSEIHYQYDCNSFQTKTEPPEQSNPEYHEDHDYFCNNEIILGALSHSKTMSAPSYLKHGSKPTVDPEVLYEEALNSRPIVYIENWEYKLKNSPCFCQTCNILFSTVNALDAHKMVSHSYLVALDIPHKNTARKSTVPSKFCNHCSKTFPDDTSLIKHLYELLPMNNFPSVKEEVGVKRSEVGSSVVKEETDERPKFQCLKCKKTFMTHGAGRWHRKIAHPNIRQVCTIVRIKQKKVKVNTKSVKLEPLEPVAVKIEPREVKIEPKEVTIEPRKIKLNPKAVKREFVSDKSDDVVALKKSGTYFAGSSLLPKNTLFQCNVCQVCFLSCTSAYHHSKMCDKETAFRKCRICKRKIRAKEIKLHRLQHDFPEKIKKYIVNNSINEKVLCRCPKCQACTDELFFLSHYNSCNNIGSAYCPDCDLTIASYRYSSHRQKHLCSKLKQQAFIIVEFENIDLPNDIKIEVMEVERRKERTKQRLKNGPMRKYSNVDGKKAIKIYFCQSCGCCQSLLSHRGHTDGECKNRIWGVYCEKCGLCFSNKSIQPHRLLHEKRQFTLKSLKIFDLSTGLRIDPPMSEFYKCKKCQKHFLFRKQVRRHDCKTERHVTCKFCSKKYSLQAYKVHKQFHSLDEALIPQLMKKYNSINNMWNILYECVACELVTMTYDSAVEHSQGHLNNIETDVMKKCGACDFNIAEKHYKSHEKLHENNDSIERGTFRMLKYNYEDLFKDSWMLLFETLPKQHRQQILSKSIYRFTRSVKMHLEISAPTEDTKYLCMNCKCHVDGTNISLHLRSKCSHSNKYICNICREVFKTLKTFATHVGSHEKVPKRQNFVTFNQDYDKEFNHQLVTIEQESKEVKKKVLNKTSKLRELLTEGVKKKYKIYKCAKCHTCVSHESSVGRHHCAIKRNTSFCPICQQKFSNTKFHMHMEAHKLKPYVNKDTLAVIYFNGRETSVENPKTDSVAKIYKCDCGLHFTSMKTIQVHLDACNPDVEVSKEMCSKCNLVFPTDVLVTHLINHHSKEVDTVIENVKQIQLLKCSQCHLIFTDTEKLHAHNDVCDQKEGLKCSECYLTFEKSSFSDHKCVNEDDDTATYINKITTINKPSKVYTVFKCGQCDISYLQYKSYKYHVVDTNHVYKIALTTCEICGLRFTQYTWQKHIKIHSSNAEGFVIKVIDPVEGTSSTITGNNPVKTNDANRSGRKREYDSIGSPSSSPKKVKYEDDIEDSIYTKKTKNSPRDRADRLYKRLSKKEADLLMPNTSKFDMNKDITDDDQSDISQENTQLLSKKLKNRMMIDKYDKKLFRCNLCNQHYMKTTSLDYHINTYDHKQTPDRKETPDNYKCDICDLDFSKHTLPRHKYVHHQIMSLNREDLIIITVNSDLSNRGNNSSLNTSEIAENKSEATKLDNDADMIECVSEAIEDNSDIIQTDSEEVNHSMTQTVNAEVNLDISQTDNEEVNLDTVSDEVNQSVSDVSEDTSENAHTVSEKSEIVANLNKASEEICYFKCEECNVCFTNRKSCYNHTLKHEILDPKTYIQCKICEFQFMIDSLKEHMDKHHDIDFKIENLTIEEYKPLGDGVEPKIDTYHAIDKVQSRLVSTTTDMGVV